MKFLLAPIAWIYGFVVWLRNLLYDDHILHSTQVSIPTICVGNLAVGGTGKTPMAEYLISLLSSDYKVAFLSRGYGRKTKGFRIANELDTAQTIGDEPMQIHMHFPDIPVAVCADRVYGIKRMLQLFPDLQCIILDDAYQHRKIKAGLNILLTDYYNLYSNDNLIPAGNLRDIKKAARRAEIIVVTKSPNVITPYYRKDIEDSLKPLPHQKVFYSYIEYQDFQPFSKISYESDIKDAKTVLLFCGIANTYSLEDHLKRKYNTISKIQFNDHHNYTGKDIDMVIEKYNDLIGKNKIIVTTEKDAMRLINSSLINKFDDIPLFTIPIKVKFHKEKGTSFDDEILNYIKKNLR